MAIKPGIKKFGITVIVAAALVGGGFYFTKHKPASFPKEDPLGLNAPAPAPAPAPTVAPAASEPAPVAVQETPAPKKTHVAHATKKKTSHPVSHGGSSGGISPEHLGHELTSDQKALQGVAGDKL